MRDSSYDTSKQARTVSRVQNIADDEVGQVPENWMKAASRAGNEASGLVGRRIRAYAEIPSRLGMCHSPTDLQAEQVRFWQTCAHDYANATRSIVEAWSSVMPIAMPSQDMLGPNNPMAAAFWMFGFGDDSMNNRHRERDRLTVPEREQRPARPSATGTTPYEVAPPTARRPAA